MTGRRTARATLIAGAAALALTACGGSTEEAEPAAEPSSAAPAQDFPEGSSMATIVEEGTVQVGTKFDQPGFGLTDLANDPAGFDVEIATYVVEQLGLTADDIEWVEAPSAERENLLEGGEVDFVVATYTINDERKQRVSFAGPYYVAGQQIMVNTGDTTVAGPEDIAANPDFQMCSVAGSTPAENILPYLAAPEQLTTFEGYDDCVSAMGNGQVDAVTTDNVILTGYVAESDGAFELVGEQFTEEPYGIGVAKGDVELCEFINTALASASEDGAYEEAWTSTAGQYEGTEVPTLPAAEPCV